MTQIEKYLQATKLIDSDHPDIVKQTESLIQGLLSPEEMAQSIFYFVRDEIRYVFRASLNREHYFASDILKKNEDSAPRNPFYFVRWHAVVESRRAFIFMTLSIILCQTHLLSCYRRPRCIDMALLHCI